MIPYGRQDIDASDIEAVLQALQSDFLTTGPFVRAFEERFAEYVGAKYAVAVSSATAALHLTMLALDVQEGDRVLTTPNTFLSTANSIVFTGGVPDFCDINSAGNLCAESLEESWNEQTKGVVAVGYGGQPCDMQRISDIARSRGGFVVEDASHCTGTRFSVDGISHFTGGHPWADATIFSFHPVKTMTTGEGGMVTTASKVIADKVREMRHHGIVKDPSRWENDTFQEKGSWYYEMQEIGYNYRISDIQCALGLSQLKKLDGFIERRRNIVEQYNESFMELPWLDVPKGEAWIEHSDKCFISWHLYSPQINFDALGLSRDAFMMKLREHGIGTQVLYIPIHLQPWYQKHLGYRNGKCPKAERFYQHTLSLPLFSKLTEAEVQHVIDSIKSMSG